MALTSRQRRILDTYRRQERALRLRTVGTVAALWGSLTSWREPDIDRFAAGASAAVTGGQQATAALTAAYLGAMESAVTRSPVRAPALAPSEIRDDALRGVPALEVYRRSGPTVWSALAAGRQVSAAVELGRMRVLSMAESDLQLAKTHASRHFMRTRGIQGYRRVIRGPETCALCIVASTQRYHSDELMPIHPGCDCHVAPIVGTQDPGWVIDPDALEGVHLRIAERFGKFTEGARQIPGSDAEFGEFVKYRDVLVTHSHGELGPILAVRGHQFTGPSDL